MLTVTLHWRGPLGFLPDLEHEWIGHQAGGGLYLMAPELSPGRHRVNYVGISKAITDRFAGYVAEVLRGEWTTCDYERFWKGERAGARNLDADEFRADPQHIREAWDYLRRCPVFVARLDPFEKARAEAIERTVIRWLLQQEPAVASYLSNRSVPEPAEPVELTIVFPTGRSIDGLPREVRWPADA